MASIIQGTAISDLELKAGAGRSIVFTTDAGTVDLSDLALTSDVQSKFVSAPSTSVGADGDMMGMIAIDANYLYYCTAAWDGVTDIWARVALSITTW